MGRLSCHDPISDRWPRYRSEESRPVPPTERPAKCKTESCVSCPSLRLILTSGLLRLLARRESFSSRREPRRCLDCRPRPGSPAPGLRHIGRIPKVTAPGHAASAWLRIRGFLCRPDRIRRLWRPQAPAAQLPEDLPPLRAREAEPPPPEPGFYSGKPSGLGAKRTIRQCPRPGSNRPRRRAPALWFC